MWGCMCSIESLSLFRRPSIYAWVQPRHPASASVRVWKLTASDIPTHTRARCGDMHFINVCANFCKKLIQSGKQKRDRQHCACICVYVCACMLGRWLSQSLPMLMPLWRPLVFFPLAFLQYPSAAGLRMWLCWLLLFSALIRIRCAPFSVVPLCFGSLPSFPTSALQRASNEFTVPHSAFVCTPLHRCCANIFFVFENIFHSFFFFFFLLLFWQHFVILYYSYIVLPPLQAATLFFLTLNICTCLYILFATQLTVILSVTVTTRHPRLPRATHWCHVM